ncbi:GNAT family N-acetyltransferase [Halalkalibaculum sp. DA3122]|uniref:GNAT family N-acetyltransferase n=1 Tax=unclassified Halalkalibaculum TaxID=2964617 RepID=UPI00375435B4
MIRTAQKEDLSAIDYIYNQAIYAGFCTGHIQPLKEDLRNRWFNRHNPHEYPVYVFEEEDQVLGWASLSPYREGREALRETAELSYYVDFKYHGREIGTQLVEHCLDQCSVLNKRVLIAFIIDGNDASVGLLEKNGFNEWGYLPEVVKHEGEIRGQSIMGKVVG